MTKTPKQRLEDYNRLNGNWPLVNGGKNDAVQSVIQCLVATENVVMNVLRGMYNKEKKTKKYPSNKIVSSTMNKVFSDMWREDLGVSRKVVNISFVTQMLNKWFRATKKHDVGKMLRFVLQRLIDEQVPLKLIRLSLKPDSKDEDTMKYYSSCKLSKMYQVLMTRRQQCFNGHQTSQKVTSIGFNLEYRKNMQINQMFGNFFNVQKAKQKCRKCKYEGEAYYGQQQYILEQLPQNLIIQVDKFDEDGNLTKPDLKVNKLLELGGLYNLNVDNKLRKDLSKLNTKYELVAVVSSKEKNIKDSEYYTLIRKNMKDQKHKQWLAYNRSTEVFINDKIACNDFPPQILIYKLSQKKE